MEPIIFFTEKIVKGQAGRVPADPLKKKINIFLNKC